MRPTWDEDMATGIAEIDADHRRIAGFFDEILVSLAEGQEHEAMVAALSRLVDALCEHIEHEDELMRAIRYPDASAHRLEHDGYFIRLSQLMVDCQKHSRCIADKVRELLYLWKFQHQDHFDRPLARAIQARREPTPALRPEFSRPLVCQ